MLRTRVIPTLLLKNGGLVKTRRFQNPVYIGDPINAVRVFNEKEVDELVCIDITATAESRTPDYALIAAIAGEAFMPIAYGGGICNKEDAKRIFGLGIEKVIVNHLLQSDPRAVEEIAINAGSSSLIASIDVRRTMFGRYQAVGDRGTRPWKESPIEVAQFAVSLGAGEVLLGAIDRDGMMSGYDLELIAGVSSAVSVPIIALGGARNIQDLRKAADQGAAGVAAGSMFVFHGKHRAVLLNYPSQDELDMALI